MKRDAAATRQRILEVATAEFARHGIAGARVDRIAAAAGSNKAMIYAYFTSKDRLFDAVFDAMVVRNVNDVPIDADDLPGYAARLSDQYARYPEAARIALWDRLERDGRGSQLPVIVEATAHKIAEVTRAQEAGLIGRHLAPEALLGLIYGIVQAPISGDAARSPEDRRRAVRESVARLIRP